MSHHEFPRQESDQEPKRRGDDLDRHDGRLLQCGCFPVHLDAHPPPAAHHHASSPPDGDPRMRQMRPRPQPRPHLTPLPRSQRIDLHLAPPVAGVTPRAHVKTPQELTRGHDHSCGPGGEGRPVDHHLHGKGPVPPAQPVGGTPTTTAFAATPPSPSRNRSTGTAIVPGPSPVSPTARARSDFADGEKRTSGSVPVPVRAVARSASSPVTSRSGGTPPAGAPHSSPLRITPRQPKKRPPRPGRGPRRLSGRWPPSRRRGPRHLPGGGDR